MEKISKSHEDYLEAIVMLGGSNENAIRSVDIANKMSVSKASVNKALVALKEKGFVKQQYYGDVVLTDEGFGYGKAVFDRHRLLKKFLTHVIGISPEVAEEEACLMEHAISDNSFEKWRDYIQKLNLE